MHSLNIFGARTSHGQIRIHKTHHGPDLREATTFPLIVYYVLLHEAHIQMAFCPNAHIQMRVSKFLELEFSQLWGPITLCVDL